MNTLYAPFENRRWLLVDDNPELLAMMALSVGKLTDAEIEYHHDPLAALGAFLASPERYELVITDLEMPHMDGIKLCHRLRGIAPSQRVMLATGSGFFTEAAAQEAGFCALLHKPFRLAEMHEALENAGLAEAVCA